MWKQSLCYHCKWKRVIINKRGSEFWLCQKSTEDDAFGKYPPQPVMYCTGFIKEKKA